MKMSKNVLFVLLLLSVMVASVSCSKNDPAPALVATTFKNLSADPPSGGYNPTNGQPIGVTKKYTLFSFATGAVVANTDSASLKWDIGFNGTNIIINSGTSGPGAAEALVVSGIFADLNLAPDNGYLQDNKNAVPAVYAITRGSGKGWYNYDQASNVISPIAGKVIMVHTADAKYVKMEILSYYQDAPLSVTSATKDRYYTFRYIYQADGSKKLQ
jgi:hypothetical protein